MVSLIASSLTRQIRRDIKRARTQRHEGMERLSTGKRINRAADDAAGMAMAARNRARLRSAHAAQRNIQDGIMSLEIADSGLQKIHDTLGRLRELALRSTNETITDGDRAIIQREFKELILEVDRIATETRFNGDRLLAQHKVDIGFVIDTSGSMGGELNRLQSSVEAFRQQFIDANLDVQFGLADVKLTTDSGDSIARLTDIGDSDFNSALNAIRLRRGAVDPYSALINASGAEDTPGTREPDAFTWRDDVAEKHLIYITDTHREADALAGPETQADVAAHILDEAVQIHALADDSDHGTFAQISSTTGGGLHDKGDASGDGIPDALDLIAEEITRGFGDVSLAYQVGPDDTPLDLFETGLPIDATIGTLGIDDASVETSGEALDAIDAIKQAVDAVSQKRGMVGATHTRMQAMYEQQQASITAHTRSTSRIEDIDMARAVARMVKGQLREEIAAETLRKAHELERQIALGLLP